MWGARDGPNAPTRRARPSSPTVGALGLSIVDYTLQDYNKSR